MQLYKADETRETLEHSLAVLSEHTFADEYKRSRMDESPFNAREDGDEELAAIDASMKQVRFEVLGNPRLRYTLKNDFRTAMVPK